MLNLSSCLRTNKALIISEHSLCVCVVVIKSRSICAILAALNKQKSFRMRTTVARCLLMRKWNVCDSCKNFLKMRCVCATFLLSVASFGVHKWKRARIASAPFFSCIHVYNYTWQTWTRCWTKAHRPLLLIRSSRIVSVSPCRILIMYSETDKWLP